jgi:hypothetical protein
MADARIRLITTALQLSYVILKRSSETEGFASLERVLLLSGS